MSLKIHKVRIINEIALKEQCCKINVNLFNYLFVSISINNLDIDICNAQLYSTKKYITKKISTFFIFYSTHVAVNKPAFALLCNSLVSGTKMCKIENFIELLIIVDASVLLFLDKFLLSLLR